MYLQVTPLNKFMVGPIEITIIFTWFILTKVVDPFDFQHINILLYTAKFF